MQSLSHREPKNSIYHGQYSAVLFDAGVYLGLQQTALKQHQSLMLIFVDELSQWKTCHLEPPLTKTPKRSGLPRY